ncbi:1-acyl-sn-glycerol-3-phosphate acyltransferase, partial [Candidatus Woesearchaeota archaeon]|nr:1-acyl-sn-glycerol-3-phosphate acyltransferase [Candidatus Woesearchaeota archaeon]
TKEEFKGPLWSSLFEYYGAIRVNGSVKKAVKALKQGKCIGLFPEGARTKTGKTQKIQHTGAGAMALLTKAPIVPIGLYTYKFWNRHMLLPNFKQNIGITIGKPIKFKTKPTEKEIEKTTKTIWNEVKKLARTSHT